MSQVLDHGSLLLLATADWDAPIATNQHHVARELAPDWAVSYSAGNGTRRLRLNLHDAARVRRRLAARPSRTTTRPVPSGVDVRPLRLLPHSRAAEAVNPLLVRRQVSGWAHGPGPRVLWTYSPFTYGLEDLADVVVYHLVDLIHQNEGVDVQAFGRAERALAGTADLAIATSPAVGEHLRSRGFARRSVRPNVSDTSRFLSTPSPTRRERSVVFAGAISAQKLDGPLLEALADALPADASLTLVGPLGGTAADASLARRLSARGAHVLPAETHERLAPRLASAAVGIVPYQLNPLTVGISPIKTYEYLACGLPVVAAALPALEPVEGCVHVEPTREAFVSRVLSLLDHDGGAAAGRRRLAAANDWGPRGHELRQVLRDLSRRATIDAGA